MNIRIELGLRHDARFVFYFFEELLDLLFPLLVLLFELLVVYLPRVLAVRQFLHLLDLFEHLLRFVFVGLQLFCALILLLFQGFVELVFLFLLLLLSLFVLLFFLLLLCLLLLRAECFGVLLLALVFFGFRFLLFLLFFLLENFQLFFCEFRQFFNPFLLSQQLGFGFGRF